MKWLCILALVLVASAIAQNATVRRAKECDPEVCVLPNCRCSGTDIPGGLAPRDTPQFVTVTFDDGVNVNNILTYRSTLFNRVNSNGCRAGATFFVSHEYTNYQIINELYNHGFEIALHSITHQVPQTYWAQATVETMEREFGDQRIQMAHFANIPMEAIKGVRIPFLQMTAEASFRVMARHNLTYDCTWPTVANRDPGLWPYTLDYKSTQDCIVPPCPTFSHPGVWVKPIVTWTDLNGVPCSFVDACIYIPRLTDEEQWYRFILTNFERHYFGNRAPFGFFVHEGFLNVNPAVRAAFVRFLDTINNLSDTFMVTGNEVIEWVKNPVPIDEYRRQPCRSFLPRNCVPSSCGNLESSHNTMRYWMQICNVCPRVYPWLNNPLGL